MLLTAREVVELTGRERRPAQCRALDAPAACPCPRTWRPDLRIVHATASRRRGFRLPGSARQNLAPERRSPART